MKFEFQYQHLKKSTFSFKKIAFENVHEMAAILSPPQCFFVFFLKGLSVKLPYLQYSSKI